MRALVDSEKSGPSRRRRRRVSVAIGTAAVVLSLLALGTTVRYFDQTYTPGTDALDPSRAIGTESAPGTAVGPDVGVDPSGPPVSLPPEVLPTDDARVVPPLPDKVVKTGEMSLRVDDGQLGQVVAEASRIAREMGGFVASSNSRTAEHGGYATVTLRIPAERFDEGVERLSGLGKMERVSTSANDVTGEYVDLAARIGNLESQREQLLALMSQAKTVQETMGIQDRLFAVTGELERLKARVASLDTRTSYGTITLTVVSGSPALGGGASWGTGKALSRAAHAFVDTLNTFIVAMGPLTFFAILGFSVWVALRPILRRRRRRRELAGGVEAEPEAA